MGTIAMARGCRGARLASELPQGQGSCVGIQGCSIEPCRGQQGHWGDSPEELGPPLPSPSLHEPEEQGPRVAATTSDAS